MANRRHSINRVDHRPAAPEDEFATTVVDMLAPLGPVQMARMFSGRGFKLDGVQFAMVLRGELYLRVDDDLAAELSALGAKPFAYKTRLRTVTVASYYTVPEDRLDDTDIVLEWARRAVAAASRLPLAAKRRRRSGIAR